jgi:hypothetical protein
LVLWNGMVRISGRKWHTLNSSWFRHGLSKLLGLKDIPMTWSRSVSEDSILQTANHHRPDSPELGRFPGSIELVLPHLHCGILHGKSCDKLETPVPRILDSGEVQQYALAE